MWVARDKDGALFLFTIRPYKVEYKGIWSCVDESDHYVEIPSGLFPETRWEDEEPKEVIIKLKKK